MRSFTDQLARTIHLLDYPKKIISVVPSQTELLFDLGLQEEVVGITKFCVHPQEWFRDKTKVGGTKSLRIETIHSLQPDLIIANKEENTKEQIDALAMRYPVWISDVQDLQTAMQMIISIGELTNKIEKADKIVNHIRKDFSNLATEVQTRNNITETAYLIWKDPYMTVGSDTFIHAMLEAGGFTNIFGKRIRYPEISITDIFCKLLLLSSEPYPFRQKQVKEIQDQLPDTKIILVDGEMFSWYGSRLLYAAEYFKKIWNELEA